MWGSPPGAPAGETTVNFIFGTFVTGFTALNSGGREIAKTGSYVAIDDFRSNFMFAAYGLTIGIVDLQLFDVLGQFSGFSAEAFGWPVGTESGSCELVDPVEINLGVVSCSRSEQVEITRTSPVSPLGWRRIRWLKRRGIVAFPAGLGPSLGSASRGMDCEDTQVRDFQEALRRCVGDVDADVLVDEECDGHDWCHERTDIGHGTRR